VLTLLLLRHAKSDWEAPYGGDDFERPLARRGEKAAARMGRFLRAIDAVPAAVVTSAAVRARTTVELAAQAGGWTCPVRETRRLYGASPEQVVEEIRNVEGDPSPLLVAGHEPTWSSLLSLLAGGGAFRLPTAALACLKCEAAAWADLAPGAASLAWLVTPKLLDAAGER
jgi:phosphohistidine phosphatase